ncbi:MAG TPA: 6-hydroxymethylpterin diphosphokinase MptE-like protein [Myxococcota bacterium]|nr:6-hydroxymethylpterin diphosphokinase MptE-like protein [Myxococcota bacterium]
MSLAVSDAALARLRRRHPEAAAACEAVEDAGVEVVCGPRGARTVSANGVLLASAYDPRAEGEKLAAEIAREPADVLVAIGFGLGHHLEAFRARSACPILVCEPSPACLRGALAARESVPLFEQPDVHLCTTPAELPRLLARVYTPGLRIRTHIHPAALRVSPEAVREAVNQLGRAKDALDATAVTRVSMMERWAEMTVDNAPEALRSPSVSRLFGALRGVPAVIAAAGPSLDRQLERLRREAGRVLVVAIGQTLRSLRAAGIEPDLVHVLESKDVSHQLTCAGDTSGLTLVVPPSVHPAVLEVPVAARYLACPVTNPIGRWIAGVLGDREFVFGGATVAQSAVQLAAALGADPILLVGQDLAFSDGRVYASGSPYESVGFRVTGDGRYVLANIVEKARLFGIDMGSRTDDDENRLVFVEGFDGGRVPTSVSYASFIQHYREIGAHLAQRGVRLVNCTEGGARLPGIEHARFEDALATCPAEAARAAERLRAAGAGFSPVAPGTFDAPIARARRDLARLSAAAGSALRDADAAAAALRRARSPQQQVEALRRVARADRQLRRELAALPWLDAVVQPEIHEALAAFRRADGAEPSPERALADSRRLFEAAQHGVERASALFDRLAERLAPAKAGRTTAGR